MKLHHWLIAAALAVACVGIGVAVVIIGFLFFRSPPPLEGQMEMHLPGGGTYRAQGDIDPEAIDPDVDAPASVVIAVKATRGDDGGQIAAITLRTGKGRKDIPLGAWRARLLAELKKAHADGDGNGSVRIEGDKRLKWASIVGLMETCKEAGFKNVGFAPPPDE